MIDKQVSKLLIKLIDDTKSGAIHWINMGSSDVRPKLSPTIDFSDTFITVDQITDFSKSYFTEYKNGRFYLLFSTNPLSMLNVGRVRLSIDTDTTKYSTTLIDTDTDEDNKSDIVSLKRLYNLVENNNSEIFSLINEFLLED